MTEALTWVKWSFDRWRNDPGLRVCGLAARGLWVDLLAIMHGCEPYGHLSINGRAPDNRQIAAVVGMTDETEVAGLLTELEDAGIFSRSHDGLIFCRKMVRDNAVGGGKKGPPASGAERTRRWRDRNKRDACVTLSDADGDGVVTLPVTPSVTQGDGDVTDGSVIHTAISVGCVVRDERRDESDATEKRREEERREEKKDSVSLRSTALTAVREPDARDRLWSEGAQQVRGLTGTSMGKSKAQVGALLKLARDDCALVLAVLAEAVDLRPIDPFPWLRQAVLARANGREGLSEQLARQFNFTIDDLPEGPQDVRQTRDNSQLAIATEIPYATDS